MKEKYTKDYFRKLEDAFKFYEEINEKYADVRLIKNHVMGGEEYIVIYRERILYIDNIDAYLGK